MSAAGWVDVSRPVRHGMVHWPGNPPIQLVRIADVLAFVMSLMLAQTGISRTIVSSK